MQHAVTGTHQTDVDLNIFDVAADDDVPATMIDEHHIRDWVLVRHLRRQLVSMT
jgi:hypothetical protein